MRDFGISRIQFREMANAGLILELKKQVGNRFIRRKMTDPVADYLTRVRNAIQANHKVVDIPASNLKKAITKILFEKGYILNYKFEDEGVQGNIKILKYNRNTKESADSRTYPC